MCGTVPRKTPELPAANTVLRHPLCVTLPDTLRLVYLQKMPDPTQMEVPDAIEVSVESEAPGTGAPADAPRKPVPVVAYSTEEADAEVSCDHFTPSVFFFRILLRSEKHLGSGFDG